MSSTSGECMVFRPTSFWKEVLITILVQVVEDGYEFFAKRHLVTLFSAPNYCGEFDNAGAMMSVDETLLCSFQVCISFPYNAARFPSLHLHYNHLTSQVNHNHICTLTFFCYRLVSYSHIWALTHYGLVADP